MNIQDLFESTSLTDRPVVNSPAFRAWFRNSKVVDSSGNPLPVYHGTARPDRVGTQFRKARATAGPMAYFTDDPTIASGYATGKADTSLDDDSMDYTNWFKVSIKGSRNPVPLDRAWLYLPQDEKQRLRELAPRVTRDDDEEIVLGDETNTRGIGNYDHAIKEARGNVLMALIDGWLQGGVLFGSEQDFLTVLKLAGMTTPIIYDHPNASYPAVYAVYMSIQNPLVSTQVPTSVVEALRKVSVRQKSVSLDSMTYAWNKNHTDGRQWFRDLLDDIERTGGKNSWTVVPDWVTKVLITFGYDGIHDIGGKNSGDNTHSVWIPFEENQVKSAISNTKFNPAKKNIHESNR